MEIKIVILGIAVMALIFIVIWLVLSVKTLEERLTDLECHDLRNKNNICSLESKVNLLNDMYELRKRAELATDRKEKMADYLAFHANDSVTKRAAALYDIATGKVIKED